MTDCVRADLRDALPDLIHDHFDPARTAEVEAHVAGCAECAAELDLLRAALASASSPPTMNIERIAAALPTST
jgi:anti-sigma factor RsiW